MSTPWSTDSLSTFRVLFFFVAVSLLGLSVIPRLSYQLYPSTSESVFQIRFQWPGALPDQVEREATSLMEGAISRSEQVKELKSVSGAGYGLVQVAYKDNVPQDRARFELSQALRQVREALPEGVGYPTIQAGGADQSNEGPFMTLAVKSSLHPSGIRRVAENTLLDPLRQLPGIQRVVLNGIPPYAWYITLDQAQLKALQLSPRTIQEALYPVLEPEFIGFEAESSGNAAGTLPVYAHVDSTLAAQLLAVPVAHQAGRIVYLRDVARVSFEEQALPRIYRINGLNTLTLTLYAEPGVNQLQLSEAVQAFLREQKPASGIRLQTQYDSTEFLRKDLRKLQVRALASVGLLLVLLVFLTRNVRYLLTVLLSLLVTLLVAALGFWAIGLSVHIYSLAGITLALGFIIDNTLIMLAHWQKHRNSQVFASILGATLTTMVAAGMIFLLDKDQRGNLEAFSQAIAICLGASLLVSYGLVPSLAKVLMPPPNQPRRSPFRRGSRGAVRVIAGYWWWLTRLRRVRWAFLPVVILAVGLPFHLLPEKLPPDHPWAEPYEKAYTDNQDLLGWAERWLGGSWGLFQREVFAGRVAADARRLTLTLSSTMPEGTSMEQMDEMMRRMEGFLSQFPEVETFQTSIEQPTSGSITVNFLPEFEASSFPIRFKTQVERKAISLGGAEWSVSGIGRGFSNVLHQGFRGETIRMRGYQYEELLAYAESLSEALEAHSRIDQVEIRGALSLYKAAKTGRYLELDPYRVALADISQPQLAAQLQSSYQAQALPNRSYLGEYQSVWLRTDAIVTPIARWDLLNLPVKSGDAWLKLAYFTQLHEKPTPREIYKRNQEYALGLAFDFNGPRLMADKVIGSTVEAFSADLPLGYQIKLDESGGWQAAEAKQYLLLGGILLIIFLFCAISLESLRLPFAIISLIPISFVGAFLGFVYFDWPFDQGGFAAFLFLGGMSVNAGIYIATTYQQYRKTHLGPVALKKAVFEKFFPILLTIITTVISLIPFVWGDRPQPFWSAFAVGTIGGLLGSLVGVFILYPLILLPKRRP